MPALASSRGHPLRRCASCVGAAYQSCKPPTRALARLTPPLLASTQVCLLVAAPCAGPPAAAFSPSARGRGAETPASALPLCSACRVDSFPAIVRGAALPQAFFKAAPPALFRCGGTRVIVVSAFTFFGCCLTAASPPSPSRPPPPLGVGGSGQPTAVAAAGRGIKETLDKHRNTCYTNSRSACRGGICRPPRKRRPSAAKRPSFGMDAFFMQ